MPQMMPLIWLLMLLSLFFIIYLIIASLHFFVVIQPTMILPTQSQVTMSPSYWNWKW